MNQKNLTARLPALSMWSLLQAIPEQSHTFPRSRLWRVWENHRRTRIWKVSQLPSNQRPAESQAPTQNLGQGRKPDFQTRPCVHSPFPPFSFWFLKKNKVEKKKKMMFPFCYYWGWRADRLHRLAWQEKKETARAQLLFIPHPAFTANILLSLGIFKSSNKPHFPKVFPPGGTASPTLKKKRQNHS